MLLLVKLGCLKTWGWSGNSDNTVPIKSKGFRLGNSLAKTCGLVIGATNLIWTYFTITIGATNLIWTYFTITQCNFLQYSLLSATS